MHHDKKNLKMNHADTVSGLSGVIIILQLNSVLNTV